MKKEKINYMAKKTGKAVAAALSQPGETNEQIEQSNDGIVTEVRSEDKDGNAFLPTLEQEVIVIPELRDAIKREKLELVPPFQAAQRALSAQKETNRDLIEKYKSKFVRDEAKGTLTYDDGEVKIEVQEKDAITYSVTKDESE